MNTPIASARSPLFAVMLSLAATGLGQIYCGRIVRGLVLFLGSLLFAPAIVVAALLPPATVVLVGLILALLAVLGVYVFAVVDARCLILRIPVDPVFTFPQFAVHAVIWFLIFRLFVSLRLGQRVILLLDLQRQDEAIDLLCRQIAARKIGITSPDPEEDHPLKAEADQANPAQSAEQPHRPRDQRANRRGFQDRADVDAALRQRCGWHQRRSLACRH